MTDDVPNSTSNPNSTEAQRREAFANFLTALDAKDMPMSMAATFQAGWDACLRRLRPPDETTIKCRANRTADPPQDCDWPWCGCDPAADKVIEALEEQGVLQNHRRYQFIRNSEAVFTGRHAELFAEMWRQMVKFGTDTIAMDRIVDKTMDEIHSPEKAKPTIEGLERLLQAEDSKPVYVHPDGTVHNTPAEKASGEQT